ncbi:unnamed protein product [Protopolystoma xenopodis]|uniref:Uncharacterized protein n=1 Tax=Protopolystoma xenopodis TaxID=117903 RepID=A0A3S5AWN6_9PLAT|nr:unnamed protein product [Protopolystoma xenopodis]
MRTKGIKQRNQSEPLLEAKEDDDDKVSRKEAITAKDHPFLEPVDEAACTGEDDNQEEAWGAGKAETCAKGHLTGGRRETLEFFTQFQGSWPGRLAMLPAFHLGRLITAIKCSFHLKQGRVKRFEGRLYQKATADSSSPAADWFYWKMHADAVSELISFDSGKKVLSFRPSYCGHHQSEVSWSQKVQVNESRGTHLVRSPLYACRDYDLPCPSILCVNPQC